MDTMLAAVGWADKDGITGRLRLFVEDLSSSEAHLLLTDATKTRIKRPAKSGVIHLRTVGNTVIGVAAGYRIAAYNLDVTVSGGGNFNVGDTNGGGEFMPNTVLPIGKKASRQRRPLPRRVRSS